MGGKPYLNIEIDEHASTVGVTTRIEAFVNSLQNRNGITPKKLDSYLANINYKEANLSPTLKNTSAETKIFIPNLQPYSELFKELLIQKGFEAHILTTNANSIELGRKHTLTNEYYSLTSLLGSCFKEVENNNGKKNIAFLIPQTEGAEVEGQYNRILRTKLDEYKHKKVRIVTPFLEDIISIGNNNFELICYCVLAGDIINVSPQKVRSKYILQTKELIKNDQLNITNLKTIAENVYSDLKEETYNKRIMAIGEPMIVYNDYLNDFVFKNLEKQKHKVVYGLLSEALWIFWKDYVEQTNIDNSHLLSQRLTKFKDDMEQIAQQLNDESPFTSSIETLLKKADSTIGYYAGDFARYRQAKALCNSAKIDGIITATSIYENTGISLNILHKGFSDENTSPILNLTFDGTKNENDKSKVESFIYYL
jgi:hypothetical protein